MANNNEQPNLADNIPVASQTESKNTKAKTLTVSPYYRFLAKKATETGSVLSPRLEGLFRKEFDAISTNEKTKNSDVEIRLKLAWNKIWGIEEEKK